METPFRRLGLAPKAGCGRSERVGAGALETEDRLFATADGEDGADLVPLCAYDCAKVCGKGRNSLQVHELCILRQNDNDTIGDLVALVTDPFVYHVYIQMVDNLENKLDIITNPDPAQ